MTCRDEVLDSARRLVAQRGANQFTVKDIVDDMMARGTTYAESTIRTHVTSRMCRNAPQNHAVKYQDFERTEHGWYRLVE